MSCSSSEATALAMMAGQSGHGLRRQASSASGVGSVGKPMLGTRAATACQKQRSSKGSGQAV